MSHFWSPVQSELEAGVNGLKVEDVTDDTKIITSRRHVVHNYGTPVAESIVLSSTYRLDNADQFQDIYDKGGYFYMRYNNATCEAAEVAINLLEGGAGSLVFSCGMAAISTTLLSFLKTGDHVVASNPLYSGTHEFLTKVLPDYKIETTLIDGHGIEEYKKAIRPNTKMIYGETPCNPALAVTDLEKFGQLGASLRSQGVVSVVDATFASPYLVKPIKYGVDIVIHSGTKYLGGHTDLLAGVVTARTTELWKELIVKRRTFGGVLSPQDAFLLLRGLKTLHVRVARQCESALCLAQFLEAHPAIERVHYPGLKSHPDHELAKRQMKMFGGMMGFIVTGGSEPAKKFVESLKIVQLAVSLGGPESLAEHPATMSHGDFIMTSEERREAKIPEGLIRFSVGLEDADDLIADVKQALAKATGK